MKNWLEQGGQNCLHYLSGFEKSGLIQIVKQFDKP